MRRRSARRRPPRKPPASVRHLGQRPAARGQGEYAATYIGTVNTEIGKEIAKRLVALKPDGGTYCIQSGGPGAVNMNERMKGMLETLPADKWTQVAGCPLYNNDDFPLSIVQMTDILAKYPDLTPCSTPAEAPQMLPEAYRQLTAR